MEFHLQCVHEYHVYGEHWTAFLGEELTCQQEKCIRPICHRCEKGHQRNCLSRAEEDFWDMQFVSSAWWYNCSHSDWSSKVFVGLSTGGLEIQCNLRFCGEEKFIL